MKPTFALKDGKPVHISDIPDDERGLKCGCICSACGRRLMARKGNKNAHHFAHYNGGECSLETIIHNTAKSIIMEAGEIHVPDTRFNYNDIVNYHLSGKVIQLSNIQDEKCMDDIQPDIIGYCKGKPLLIEIYVTHKVDTGKIQKIKHKGISAIEIDLSNIGYDTDINELKQLVLYKTTNRYWINNVRINELRKRFLSHIEYKSVFTCSWTEKVKFYIYEHSDSASFSDMLTEDYEYRNKVMSFVIDCPIEKNTIDGQSYALVNDCMKCKYKYEDDLHDSRIACACNK